MFSVLRFNGLKWIISLILFTFLEGINSINSTASQMTAHSHVSYAIWHIKYLLKNRLHWLDIRARIEYKLCLTICWSLNGSACSTLYCQSLHSCVIHCLSEATRLGQIWNAGRTSMQHQDNWFVRCMTLLAPGTIFQLNCPARARAAYKKELATVFFSGKLLRQRWFSSSLMFTIVFIIYFVS